MVAPTLTDLSTTVGYIRCQWTDASKPANFYAWRVYHRDVQEPSWTKVFETFIDSAAYDENVYGWANAVPQEMVVVGVSQDPGTGALTETAYSGAVIFTPIATDANYWLVHPDDPGFIVRLQMVKSAPSQYGNDHQVLDLIGRGNKVNVGDDTMSVSGSLSFQLYNILGGRTARQQRQDIVALSRLGVRLFLRTPFGDMWSIFLRTVSVDPVAGVAGQIEAANGSLSFVEVA